MWRRVAKIGGGALITSGLGAYAFAQYDEGFKRTLLFWGQVGPIYLHYRLTEHFVKDLPEYEQSARWNALHDRYAGFVEELALDLKGFYTKAAQIVSTRDEIVPPQYMKWCKKMQDQVPSEFLPGEVERIVEKHLGKKIPEVFEYFDPKPLGAASIGVVHRARLKGSGKEVVVKVQYPGIERRFRADITTLKGFCAIAMPHQVPFLEEVERQFMFEFDYRDEAEHLKTIKENLIKGGWGKKVVVPEPVTELCTQQVLVMEYLPGKKLIDGLREQFRKVAARQGKTLEQLEEEQKRLIQEGKIKKKSVDEYSREIQFYNSLFAVSDGFVNTFVYISNVLAIPFGKKIAYRQSPRLINMGEILDTLLKVHAHEIFVDGAFNGDPHPGNILLLPDGRLGLIDYGQVKNIKPEIRYTYAKLILALNRDDKEEVVRIINKEIGVQTKYSNPEILYKFAAFWNDRDTDDVTMGLNIQLFMEYLERVDPIVKVNEDYLMCGRVSILLRGIGNAFGMRLRVSDFWKPYAEKALVLHAGKQKVDKP